MHLFVRRLYLSNICQQSLQPFCELYNNVFPLHDLHKNQRLHRISWLCLHLIAQNEGRLCSLPPIPYPEKVTIHASCCLTEAQNRMELTTHSILLPNTTKVSGSSCNIQSPLIYPNNTFYNLMIYLWQGFWETEWILPVLPDFTLLHLYGMVPQQLQNLIAIVCCY